MAIYGKDSHNPNSPLISGPRSYNWKWRVVLISRTIVVLSMHRKYTCVVGTLGALFKRVAGLLSRSSHAHTSNMFISNGYCGGRTFELFDTTRLGFSLPFVEV